MKRPDEDIFIIEYKDSLKDWYEQNIV
jgi:hypothetical protein